MTLQAVAKLVVFVPVAAILLTGVPAYAGNLASFAGKSTTLSTNTPVVRDHRGAAPVRPAPTQHWNWGGSHPKRCPASSPSCIPSGNIRDHRS